MAGGMQSAQRGFLAYSRDMESSADQAAGAHTGVAPGAHLVAVKVAGANGAADVSTLLQGMHGVAVTASAALTGATARGPLRIVGPRTLGFASGVLTPATSGVINVTAGAATQIAPNGGDNQSATVGTAVATAPSVIVTDASGNRMSSALAVNETRSMASQRDESGKPLFAASIRPSASKRSNLSRVL